MKKRDLTKYFIGEIYSCVPKKNYETNKIFYNQVDEIWNIDLADTVDFKISNKKGYRYILVINHKFSKYTWCIPLKHKYGETILEAFSKILSTSKRKPLNLESDTRAEFYISIFQTF